MFRVVQHLISLRASFDRVVWIHTDALKLSFEAVSTHWNSIIAF